MEPENKNTAPLPPIYKRPEYYFLGAATALAAAGGPVGSFVFGLGVYALSAVALVRQIKKRSSPRVLRFIIPSLSVGILSMAGGAGYQVHRSITVEDRISAAEPRKVIDRLSSAFRQGQRDATISVSGTQIVKELTSWRSKELDSIVTYSMKEPVEIDGRVICLAGQENWPKNETEKELFPEGSSRATIEPNVETGGATLVVKASSHPFGVAAVKHEGLVVEAPAEDGAKRLLFVPIRKEAKPAPKVGG